MRKFFSPTMRLSKKLPIKFILTALIATTIVYMLSEVDWSQWRSAETGSVRWVEETPDDAIQKLDHNVNKHDWFVDLPTSLPIRYYNLNSSALLGIWPNESASDRIINQLMYIPKGYDPYVGFRNEHPKMRLKTIAFANNLVGWMDVPKEREFFLRNKCPVNTCRLTDNRTEIATADALIYRDYYVPDYGFLPKWNQVTIFHTLEAPPNTGYYSTQGSVFNWTATYRNDSEIVTPYAKFAQFAGKIDAEINMTIIKNKTKKVAWFVSNCLTDNKRSEYAKKLARYIQVDIFGSCGRLKCPLEQREQCFDMLKYEYKFYLSFENTNCQEYITEKFFVNGLGLNKPNYYLIPIVMGARRQDYESVASPDSFIHVDDFESPKKLAEFLHQIDANDTLFVQYQQWKTRGRFINNFWFCRLCALLHAPPKPRVYLDFVSWWTVGCED